MDSEAREDKIAEQRLFEASIGFGRSTSGSDEEFASDDSYSDLDDERQEIYLQYQEIVLALNQDRAARIAVERGAARRAAKRAAASAAAAGVATTSGSSRQRVSKERPKAYEAEHPSVLAQLQKKYEAKIAQLQLEIEQLKATAAQKHHDVARAALPSKEKPPAPAPSSQSTSTKKQGQGQGQGPRKEPQKHPRPGRDVVSRTKKK